MSLTWNAQQWGLWKRRIVDAKGYQAQHHLRWEKSLQLYDMDYWRRIGWTGSYDDEDVPVNYATTMVTTLVSSIYARNPKMFVRARNPRFYKFAETMERLLERHWDVTERKELMIKLVVDTVIFGIGWLELGRTPDSGLIPKPDESAQATGLIERVKSMVLGTEAKQPAEEGILDPHRERGEFYALRRSPYRVLVPRGFNSYLEMPYGILWERLHLEDFLNGPYEGKEEVAGSFKQGDIPDDERYVDLYTIWDRRSQSTFTITERTDIPQVRPAEWPYYSQGFPLIPLTFNWVPNDDLAANFYPYGDVEPIFAQVIEKSNIRKQMVAHRKRANQTVFVQKGTLTETEITNYATASGALEVVPVANIQAIQVGPAIQIPPAIFQTETAINSDLERDSGLQLILADLARVGQIERATVAVQAQGNANLKTNFRVDRIEAMCKRQARFEAGLFWQYLTRFDVGDILGELPDEQSWIDLPSDNPQLARQRIRRELEFRIEAGSTRPIQDDVLDREQFIRATATVQQVAPDIFDKVKAPWVAELVKRFRMPDLESLVLQALSQQDQQFAMQEEQLLSQNLPVLVDPNHNHAVHKQVHAAASQKAPPTQARDQHLLQHDQMEQAKLQGQGGTGQGVRQSVAAPSAAEVSRMGTPTASDVGGQAMNLRQGTGGTPLNV